MQITERDIHILTFINDFGYCGIGHLNQRFRLNKPRNYQIMKRLSKANLIKHERIFYQRPGIFRVTKKGAAYTSLPPLKKIILGNYEHDLKTITIALKLQSLYPEGVWLSERHLKCEKFRTGVGKRGHIADGFLLLPDDKRVAIEVELTPKGKSRIERIIKQYGGSFGFFEVWYFCPEGMVASLQNMTVKKPFIKIFSITGFLK